MIDCSNSSWRSAFNRARGTPKRPAIYAIGVEVQHPIREFPGGGRPFYEPIEIANVLAGFLNDARAVIIADALMSRDHRAWIKRLDLVERRNPLEAAFVRAALCQILMDVVVGDIPCNEQSDGWNTTGQVVLSVSVWPTSTATKSCPSRLKVSLSRRSAITSRSGI